MDLLNPHEAIRAFLNADSDRKLRAQKLLPRRFQVYANEKFDWATHFSEEKFPNSSRRDKMLANINDALRMALDSSDSEADLQNVAKKLKPRKRKREEKKYLSAEQASLSETQLDVIQSNVDFKRILTMVGFNGFYKSWDSFCKALIEKEEPAMLLVKNHWNDCLEGESVEAVSQSFSEWKVDVAEDFDTFPTLDMPSPQIDDTKPDPKVETEPKTDTGVEATKQDLRNFEEFCEKFQKKNQAQWLEFKTEGLSYLKNQNKVSDQVTGKKRQREASVTSDLPHTKRQKAQENFSLPDFTDGKGNRYSFDSETKETVKKRVREQINERFGEQVSHETWTSQRYIELQHGAPTSHQKRVNERWSNVVPKPKKQLFISEQRSVHVSNENFVGMCPFRYKLSTLLARKNIDSVPITEIKLEVGAEKWCKNQRSNNREMTYKMQRVTRQMLAEDFVFRRTLDSCLTQTLSRFSEITVPADDTVGTSALKAVDNLLKTMKESIFTIRTWHAQNLSDFNILETQDKTKAASRKATETDMMTRFYEHTYAHPTFPDLFTDELTDSVPIQSSRYKKGFKAHFHKEWKSSLSSKLQEIGAREKRSERAKKCKFCKTGKTVPKKFQQQAQTQRNRKTTEKDVGKNDKPRKLPKKGNRRVCPVCKKKMMGSSGYCHVCNKRTGSTVEKPTKTQA